MMSCTTLDSGNQTYDCTSSILTNYIVVHLKTKVFHVLKKINNNIFKSFNSLYN